MKIHLSWAVCFFELWYVVSHFIGCSMKVTKVVFYSEFINYQQQGCISPAVFFLIQLLSATWWVFSLLTVKIGFLSQRGSASYWDQNVLLSKPTSCTSSCWSLLVHTCSIFTAVVSLLRPNVNSHCPMTKYKLLLTSWCNCRILTIVFILQIAG